MTRFAAALALALVPIPALVCAQTPAPPSLAVGGGGGIAFPLHGDFDFQPAAWHVTVRARTATYLWIEGEYGQWRHAENDVRLNQPITGPGGPLGRIDRLTIETRHLNQTLALNVLAGGSSGRVHIWGGGGPAFLDYSRRFRQTPEGCQGNVPCGSFENTHSSGQFAVQLTAGVDVALTRWIGVYGQYKFVSPIDDPGSGHQAILGGARLVLTR
jgi:hypothetical protein